MTGSTPDFALIGHLSSWQQAVDAVNYFRRDSLDPLPLQTVQETYDWIPPRKLFDVDVTASDGDRKVSGIYIETFIPPGSGLLRNLRGNIEKIRQAAGIARKAGARIVALGGFSSVLLESDADSLREAGVDTVFTTGNTLTAAFIAESIERAVAARGRALAELNLLVIGATGDIGQAIVRWFSGRAGSLLLCARNRRRLGALEAALQAEGHAATADTDLSALLPQADVIVSVAAAVEPLFSVADCKPGAIVCDAGYPKNIVPAAGTDVLLYHGGMGQVQGGVRYSSELPRQIYRYPQPGIGHGCLLEAVVLALQADYTAISTGRGHITTAAMAKMVDFARNHGIMAAPYFNSSGLLSVVSS